MLSLLGNYYIVALSSYPLKKTKPLVHPKRKRRFVPLAARGMLILHACWRPGASRTLAAAFSCRWNGSVSSVKRRSRYVTLLVPQSPCLSYEILPFSGDNRRRGLSSLVLEDTSESSDIENEVPPASPSVFVNPTSPFRVTSPYPPAGDQPEAIARLTQQLQEGDNFSVLRGITGTGKTMVMAHVIANRGQPCLVLCHNKTLAAQLARELRSFLSENAVELFVSYYNLYRPEAYIEQSGKYLAKKSSVNAEIDALRHRATRSLLTRNDVVVVASVSCIYGLGFPKEYLDMSNELHVGQEYASLAAFLSLWETMLYTVAEDDTAFERGQYQLERFDDGDVKIIVWPPQEQCPMQILLQPTTSSTTTPVNKDDPPYTIQSIGLGTTQGLTAIPSVHVFPAKHHVISEASLEVALETIRAEMREQVSLFQSQGKQIEAQRLQTRVEQDLEMLRENGYCQGCENYSRHLAHRQAGDPPDTLMDYFGWMGERNWLLIVDESHVTLPQLSAMYIGDRERKKKLVRHGYRLPSALDNRPLTDGEFWKRVDQAVLVSATPSALDLSLTHREPIDMIIRPTFVCDPEVEVRPSAGQLEDLLVEVQKRVERNQRTLAVALTKRDAEDLSSFLQQHSLKSTYLHSGLKTNDRANALKALQNGEVDCLVGVNLLREGLDLPQVSLVAILSADKQGFLRSETSLMQTIGRAARNIEGKAILYAKTITASMQKCIDETHRRRTKQLAFNEAHGRIAKSTQGSSTLSIFDLAKEEIDSEMTLTVPRKKKDAPCGVAESEQFLGEVNAVQVPIIQSNASTSKDSKPTITTDHIPTSPGIYMWRDSEDKILYIGKAANLRSRVRSYHAKSAQHSQRIVSMLKKATSVSFVLTPSERDALVLESNLIKHHQPRYNVLLKDDEHYPYICATCGDEYPRLKVVPIKTESALTTNAHRYFGPYTNFNEINAILDYVEDKFDLRGKSFQVRHGSGSKEEYHKLFEQMMLEVFTEGSSNDTVRDMRLEYEQAGVLFESEHNTCRDVVAVAKSPEKKDSVVVHVMQLRDGLVAGRFTYSCHLPNGSDTEEDFGDAIFAVLSSRHYPSGGESRGGFGWFPDDILLSHVPADVKGLKNIIQRFGKEATPPRKTKINVGGVAKKGKMMEVDKRTMELAVKNANQAAMEKSAGDMNVGVIDGSGALELGKLVGCEKAPSRVECYVCVIAIAFCCCSI
jgi:excinuclease ABC subunit B